VITQCCVCQKVRLDEGWATPVDDSFVEGIPVSHTYCPQCLEKAVAELVKQKPS